LDHEIFGFRRKLQAERTGMLHELVEIERLVDLGQLVMEKVRRRIMHHPLQFLVEQTAEFVRFRLGIGEKFKQRLSLMNLGEGIGRIIDMIQHHLPEHVANMTARIGVVADKSHPMGGQTGGVDRDGRSGGGTAAPGR
jgi:hypothetical protein